MVKSLSTIAALVSATSVLFVTSPADAQDCRPNVRIGFQCTQDIKIIARTDYPNSDSKAGAYSPPPGYRITNYEEVINSRFGSGGNLNINVVRGGEVTKIRRVASNYNKSISERQSKARSYAQWAAAKVGGETETLEKAIKENDSRIALLDDSFSTIDRLDYSVTVSGRCTRNVLGTCVDNEGGKYDGTLRVKSEYVGTVASVSAANDAVLRRADTVLVELEAIKQKALQAQQTPPQQPTPASPAQPPSSQASTSGAFCPDSAPQQDSEVKAPVAFFNEWNTPVTVFVYSNGSRSSATVPPGVNSVIAGAVNSNDGICFVDRPGISPTGVVNRIGSIADFDTNWGNQGLFMIQNPRIK